MTIHLPNDLERDIEAAVHNGRFRSVDGSGKRDGFDFAKLGKREAGRVRFC
jgi:hypothetical protein